MSAPILWILLPAVISVLLLLFKRSESRFFPFIVASLFFALTPFFIRIDPVGEIAFFEFEIRSDLNILGRSFILTENDLFLVQVVYFFNAVWGLFAYFFNRHNRVVPLGLLFSAMLLSAYAVTPFLYAALILELCVILTIPLMNKKIGETYRGISRYLIYQTLALPFILLAGWFLAGGEITPVNPSQLVQATLLLGLGFILWLGVFPFHTWIPLLHRESDSLNIGYLLQLLIFIVFLVILKFINGFSWLRQYDLFYNAMLLLGIIMEVLGAVGIFFQKNLKDIVGYAFLHMIGMVLVSIGLYPLANIYIFPAMLAIFLVNISLMHLTIEKLQSDIDDANLEITKSTRWNSITLLAFVFSLLSMAGMPLTIGFPPTQWIYQVLARSNNGYAWIHFLSKIMITIPAIRLFGVVYRAPIEMQRIMPKTSRDWVFIILLLLAFLAGLFPQFIFTNFNQLVTGFENLIQ